MYNSNKKNYFSLHLYTIHTAWQFLWESNHGNSLISLYKEKTEHKYFRKQSTVKARHLGVASKQVKAMYIYKQTHVPSVHATTENTANNSLILTFKLRRRIIEFLCTKEGQHSQLPQIDLENARHVHTRVSF